MKFGFDIDDTLINLREHAFHLYNKKLNQKVPIDHFHELKRVEIHEPFGLTDEQGKEMWKQSLEEIYFTSCPPYPEAVETLQQLDKQGHEIYYITSRPMGYRDQTMEWLKERGFPIRDDRFFYGMQDHEKVDIIKNLKLDYYFDDKPAVLNTLLQESTKLFVRDQSYNRDLDLPRIVNWSDFSTVLECEIEKREV
ncbi:5' nucleotidase, NT5C type [Neobacillus bataviensis]|uniref:5' nucleotidase, NT5C type n=1 Tax=Neobacillus bataviensis TaxID=220685 RepID=UPI001CC03B23|nr:HAD family acid phosphatase [Neobacillus bataviensis]